MNSPFAVSESLVSVKCMSALESLQEVPCGPGGLQSSLYKAVKGKPGFQWKPQDVGDARAMGHLPRRTECSEDMCCKQNVQKHRAHLSPFKLQI